MPSKNKRFKKLCDRFGYHIKGVVCQINGKLTRRPDILSVQSNVAWVMTIPKRMYSLSNPGHRDLFGTQHPDFWECEAKLYGQKYA